MTKVRFGADGIRYIAGTPPLDNAGAHRIGCAIGRYLSARRSQPEVILGRDTRSSGVWLAEALAEALLAESVNVIDAGVTTTPSIAFLTRDRDADMGIAISASHNPAEYNGIKLIGRSGLRLQREDEIEIENLINDPSLESAPAGRAKGEYTNGTHLRELYIQHHVQHAPIASLAGLTVVLDCAHGAALYVAPEAFRRLDAQVTVINGEPDGENINLRSGSERVRRDPTELLAAIQAHRAAYGFAFDGDGDRLVVVDADGHVYNGDDLLFALARFYHARGQLRGSRVVTTHLANRGLDAALMRLGIEVVRAGKGDKALEAAMWSIGSTLGGEPVGNIIINDGHHTAADAVYAALMLASILHSKQIGMAAFVAPFEKWPQLLVSLSLPERSLAQALGAIEGRIRQYRGQLGSDWRMLTWRSSTEPDVIRFMVEGGPGQQFEDAQALALSICRTAQDAAGTDTCQLTSETLSSRKVL